VTKYISSKDNATFEKTVSNTYSYNNLKPLPSFPNMNKGRKKIHNCKDLKNKLNFMA
jgi:hypothetical protein